jgi:hypothetical protein
MRKLFLFITLILAMLLSGCASVPMNIAPEQTLVEVKPNESQVVFFRSSFFGSAIGSSIYEIKGEDAQFLGVLNNGNKIAVKASTGKHLFMVVSEAADFMNADLAGGKTYYAIVTPRMGAWKARFSMWPVSTDAASEFNTTDGKLEKWMADTTLVSTSDSARAWYQKNRERVDSKMREYLPVWNQKSAGDMEERTLKPEDGVAVSIGQKVNEPPAYNESVSGVKLDDTGVTPIDFYGQAEEEADTKTYDKNIWAKALVEAEGDETKRKVKYIELRANQLYSQEVGLTETSELINTPTTPLFDLTGNYTSKVSAPGGAYFPWVFQGKQKVKFNLNQKGNTVKGRFTSGLSGSIEGTLERDRIVFSWYTANCSMGTGEWKVSPDGNSLEGQWSCDSYAVEGEWNAQKK